MPVFNVIASIFISILIIGFFYVTTMLCYFAIRKKDSSRKLPSEVVILGVAYLISVAIRFVICLIENDVLSSGMWESVEMFWRAMHSSIGGFAFEGLDGLEKTGIVGRLVYVGSSLYTGLVVLTVISTGVSHGIYSQIALVAVKTKMAILTLFKKFIKSVNNQIDIYVFTAITEDAVMLCESIDGEYEKGGKNYKRRKLIVFAGNDLEVFDRKNPLHAKIVAKGYLYIQLSSNMENRSIIDYFSFFINNDYCLFEEKIAIEREKALKQIDLLKIDQTKKNEQISKINLKFDKLIKANQFKGRDDSRLHLFALGLSEDKTGLETVNSAVIFDEISAILNKWVKVQKGEKLKLINTLVDFYALTDTDVNYNYYENKLVEIIKNHLKKIGFNNNENHDRYFKILKKYFSLHIISEAVMSSECMIKNRNAYFAEQQKAHGLNLALNTVIKPSHRAMVLGFGANGQQALNNLIINVSSLDENDNPGKFVADVYDKYIDNYSGIFSFEHPLHVCVNQGDNPKPFVGSVVDYATPKLKKMFDYSVCEKRAKGVFDKEKCFEQVAEKMGFPLICFHSSNCYSLEFLKQFDYFTGVDINKALNKGDQKVKYDSIIVSLGDDESTILMANALIDDVKYELSVFGNDKGYDQVIYVNLRDKNNYSRINWKESDQEKFSNLSVIIYGSAQEMYCYETIIEENQSMLFNFAYDVIYSEQKFNPENIDKIFDGSDNSENCDWAYGNDLKEFMVGLNFNTLRKKWLGLDIFSKKSNYYVGLWKEFLHEYIKFLKAEVGEFNAECVVKVAKLEHVRWNRFHICHGWMFADYNPKETRLPRSLRQHDCLCPFETLVCKSGDMANVIMASAKMED